MKMEGIKMQWNSENEAREAIKAMVADYYHQFK